MEKQASSGVIVMNDRYSEIDELLVYIQDHIYEPLSQPCFLQPLPFRANL
ncbi:hypothetical protein EDD64_1367 [Effusibacillus lacus]|nr:hypothetical protein EDD64_1367 [Effusibacillus lacus]